MFPGTTYNGNMIDSITGTSFQFIQKSNYPGNNIITPVTNNLVCNESVFSYYNPATLACTSINNLIKLAIYNLNVLNDITFPNIPSSFTNRWTMDLWIWVEIAQQLTSGINFIWQNHLSISIVRDTSSTTNLNVLCFPQGYNNSINGVSGVQIYDVYNSALNKSKDSFVASSSTWNFVRCSVDLTRGQFYLNGVSSVTIINETLYTGVKNSLPYRYFNINPQQSMIIQNASLNNSRIFMAYLSLYREFIPYNFINLAYKFIFFKLGI